MCYPCIWCEKSINLCKFQIDLVTNIQIIRQDMVRLARCMATGVSSNFSMIHCVTLSSGSFIQCSPFSDYVVVLKVFITHEAPRLLKCFHVRLDLARNFNCS